ncbi:hypothetical protein BCR33DRAFT_716914 [Rhizoclosmatium globosum]|uniref:Myb-like domain-containing protein n=1 Tax=Rhizoclosmatium globosum TaxID=329046 RepID=A0A1Y2CBE3_9FUNG|nr:hypothetical protein BCR33DRAFT_716914 [Rhizoclosmatium globosum]|eukprot:ORY44360.1 hypothetical protein BCR33DRAFT_716914 [Rhizoclosmatium globosum]
MSKSTATQVPTEGTLRDPSAAEGSEPKNTTQAQAQVVLAHSAVASAVLTRCLSFQDPVATSEHVRNLEQTLDAKLNQQAQSSLDTDDDFIDIEDLGPEDDLPATDQNSAVSSPSKPAIATTLTADEKIKTIGDQLDNLVTIRKSRVFDSEITTEEADLIQKRVALQQERFKAFEEREFQTKSARILAVFNNLTADEIREALKDCNHDEDAVILKMTDDDEYLQTIRRTVALQKRAKTKSQAKETSSKPTSPRRKSPPRKRNSKKIDENEIPSTSKAGKKPTLSRFKIDAIAEPDVNPTEIFAGWSKARVDAYKSIDACPNRYYYRFNKPGEMQRNGIWTDEKKLFMDRLKEVGANGQWGIFSIPIPGRVGYQCATFYRSLVRAGKIKDSNYTITSKGDLRFHGGNESVDDDENQKRRGIKRKTDSMIDIEGDDEDNDANGDLDVETSSASGQQPTQELVKKRRKPRIKRKPRRSRGTNSSDASEPNSEVSVEDGEKGGEVVKTSWTQIEETTSLDENNPLPGMIDPITLENIVRPAISPYGHVVGYDTWNVSVYQEPLSRRELVMLTWDNIEEYRDKIIV